MEDIQKLLEKNEDYLTSSSDEYDSENESLSIWNLRKNNKDVSLASIFPNIEKTKSNSITSKKRNGEERLPTRKPDPNVYNRNALLARENRRKKKVYLETIEKELEVARKSNRALLKALKRQLKVGRRLEQEKKYFEGLISNRAEILGLVNALNFRRTPESESDKSSLSSSTNLDDYAFSSMGEIPSTKSFNSRCNNADLSTHFDNPSDDLENATVSSFPASTTCDGIWSDTGYNLISSESYTQCKNTVNDDHCYTRTLEMPRNAIDNLFCNESSNDIDVEGACLLRQEEICDVLSSSSNWSSASQTLPLQLLTDS